MVLTGAVVLFFAASHFPARAASAQTEHSDPCEAVYWPEGEPHEVSMKGIVLSVVSRPSPLPARTFLGISVGSGFDAKHYVLLVPGIAKLKTRQQVEISGWMNCFTWERYEHLRAKKYGSEREPSPEENAELQRYVDAIDGHQSLAASLGQDTDRVRDFDYLLFILADTPPKVLTATIKK